MPVRRCRLHLSCASGERGSIVIGAAITIVAFGLLGALLVEVGQWFQHRRHVQVRADSAALAGGQALNACFDIPSVYTEATADTYIESWAKSYGGLTGGALAAPYNKQFGTSSSNLMSFQSDSFPSAGTPTPARNLDNECFQADGVTPNLTLDVKMAQEGIPPLFSFSPLATVHGWARVQLQEVASLKPSLPLAIPEVNPKQVDVTFVNESSGNELTGCSGAALVPNTKPGNPTCSFYLTKQSSGGGLTPWNGDATVNVPGAGSNVGVRVGIGGEVGNCANSTGGANYSCYDINHTNNGVVMIRSYATGGSRTGTNPPILHGVWPGSTCSGSPFFADINVTSANPNCDVGLEADVDFGTGATDPTTAGSCVGGVCTGGVGAVLTATINGNPVTMMPDHYDASIPGWVFNLPGGTASIPVDAANGTTSQYPIKLSWSEARGTKYCPSPGAPRCGNNFNSGNPVQRYTSATDDDDGPIKAFSLSDGSSKGPLSLTSGTHTLTVNVSLEGNLSVQNPPQELNLRLTGTGSRTQGVNCDGTGNNDFTNSLQNGCATPYQPNDNDLCPDPSPPVGAADCVPLKTGDLGQTVTNALNARFSPCPANNWPNTAVSGDKRIVTLMITDFSALGGGSGKTEIPVTNFASFYLMGWSGNHCNDAWPFSYQQPGSGKGNIWGYFINYSTGGGIPSGRQCQIGVITPCAPALVR